MEFLSNGLGIIWEDSASIICRDETKNMVKKMPEAGLIPFNLILVESESFPFRLWTPLTALAVQS